MIIRQARAADIPAMVALRMELFCEVGELLTPQADPALWQATLDYFTRAMSEERVLYPGWLRPIRRMAANRSWRRGRWHCLNGHPIPAIWRGWRGICSTCIRGHNGASRGSPRRCSMPLQLSPARASWARCGSMPASRGVLSMSGSALSPIRPIWSGTWHLNRWAPLSLWFLV